MIYKRSCEKTNTITEEEKKLITLLSQTKFSKRLYHKYKKNEKCVAPYGEILGGSVQPAMLGLTKTHFF